ncbi:MAG: hypothetical protein ACI9S8_001899 [Chlamydiales bacterium]|jgi:hypothetical protein
MTAASSSSSIVAPAFLNDPNRLFAKQTPATSMEREIGQTAQEILLSSKLELPPIKRRRDESDDKDYNLERPAKRVRHSCPIDVILENLKPEDISASLPVTPTFKIRLSLVNLTNPHFLALAENLSITQVQELLPSFSENHLNTMITLFREDRSQTNWVKKLRILFSSFSPEQLCQKISSLTHEQLHALIPTWTSKKELYAIAEICPTPQLIRMISLFSYDQLKPVFKALPMEKVLSAYNALQETQKEKILSKTTSFDERSFTSQKLSTIQSVVAIKTLDLADSTLNALLLNMPLMQVPAALAVMSPHQIWAVIPKLSLHQRDYLIRPLMDVSSDIFPYLLGVMEGGILAAGIGNLDFSKRIMDNLAHLSLSQISIMLPVMSSSQVFKILSLSSSPIILTNIAQSASIQHRKDIGDQVNLGRRSINLAFPSIAKEFQDLSEELSRSLNLFTGLIKRFDAIHPESPNEEKQSCLRDLTEIRETLMVDLKPRLLSLLSQTQGFKASVANYVKALPLLNCPRLEEQLSLLETKIQELGSQIHPCLRKIDSGVSQSGLQYNMNRMTRSLDPSHKGFTLPISNRIAYDRDKVMALYEGARDVLNHLHADYDSFLNLDITYEDLIAKKITSVREARQLGIETLEDLGAYLRTTN